MARLQLFDAASCTYTYVLFDNTNRDALIIDPVAATQDLMQMRTASGYAGDVSVQLAYQWCQADDAVLIDVRTDAKGAICTEQASSKLTIVVE